MIEEDQHVSSCDGGTADLYRWQVCREERVGSREAATARAKDLALTHLPHRVYQTMPGHGWGDQPGRRVYRQDSGGWLVRVAEGDYWAHFRLSVVELVAVVEEAVPPVVS